MFTRVFERYACGIWRLASINLMYNRGVATTSDTPTQKRRNTVITKSFSGATGTGVRHFVAAQTKQVATSDILIIAAHPELAAQWADILPGAQAITASKWQPTGQHKLIIADEMHDYMFSRLITPLQQIDAPVWLINRDIPVTPFIAAAPQQLGCEPF